MRGDAAANRAAIIDAAARLWVRLGEVVPLDAVAAQAGVGIGTLYRHFRDREALYDAIVDESYNTLVRLAEAAAAETGSARAALDRFIAGTVTASPRLLLPLLGRGRGADNRHHVHEDTITTALDAVLDRGKAAGEIRADVTAIDLIVASAALLSVTLPGDSEHRAQARVWALLLDGMGPSAAASALPESLDRAQLNEAMPTRTASPSANTGDTALPTANTGEPKRSTR